MKSFLNFLTEVRRRPALTGSPLPDPYRGLSDTAHKLSSEANKASEHATTPEMHRAASEAHIKATKAHHAAEMQAPSELREKHHKEHREHHIDSQMHHEWKFNLASNPHADETYRSENHNAQVMSKLATKHTNRAERTGLKRHHRIAAEAHMDAAAAHGETALFAPAEESHLAHRSLMRFHETQASKHYDEGYGKNRWHH